MSDDVTYESGYGRTQPPGDDRLRETIAELTETIRDAARRTAALDARIDALPGPMEIASAVESEVERSVREARDVIDARVGSLGADLESLSRRLAEVSESLVPLEGLRTEIATVADESASFHETRALLQTALEQLSGGQLPTVAGDTIGAEVDKRLDQFRRVLEETATTIRSDFEMLVGAEKDVSERRNDALGLRITNLSVGVTKTLEDLTAQSERMGERARAIEGENAAILQAIKNEIAGASGVQREEVKDETGPKLLSALQDLAARIGAVESRLAQRAESADPTGPLLVALDEVVAKVGTIESRIAERLTSLESNVVERPGDPGVEALRGQMTELSRVQPVIEEMRTQLSGLSRIEPALADVGAQLSEISRKEPADPTGPLLVALDALVAKMGTIESRIAERLTSLESKVAERAGDPAVQDLRVQVPELARVQPAIEEMRMRLSELISRVGPTLDDVGAQLVKLSRIEPALDDVGAQLAALAHGDPSFADVRAGLAELSRVEPVLSDIRNQIREIARLQPSQADSEASKALLSSAVEQLRATLDGAVVAMEQSVAQSINEMQGRLDAVEAAVARAVVDTSDALDGAAAQTAGGMQDLRVALGQLTESTSGIERIRQELFQAMESFSTQLVTRTAGVKTSITERAGRLEEKISALPGRDDLADALLQRLTPAIAEGDGERQEKIAGLEQELGGVASNVNEIWIRVRAMVKGLEEQRAAAREDAERTASRIEHLALGEDRLAVRLIEAEARLAESMRAVETERDRVFLEMMSDLLEQLPRRERKLFRRRVREVPPRRGEPAPPPPPEPAIPPPRLTPVAPPPAGARAAEPPRAKPKAKPKPKPKPKPKAKAKPKPKPKATATPAAPPKPEATATPAAPPEPEMPPAPSSKPKPVAKAKPKPKPAARPAKPAVRDVKPEKMEQASSSPQPSAEPTPPIEQTEANAVVDTHAPDEAPEKASASSPDQDAAERPSGADSGV